MNELTNHTNAFVHFKRSSWLSRLSDIKMIIGLFAAFSAYVGSWVLLITAAQGALPQVFVPVCFFTWFAMGMLSMSLMQFADRRLLCPTKRRLTALEDRLIACKSQCLPEDLDQLVTGSLKLKRITAADIYSKRLLAISMTDDRQKTSKASEWIATTECWASTDNYHKTFQYMLIWRETRGVLTLTPDSLDFESNLFTFHCHPTQIVSLEIKRHPLWVKPIPLKFISITIDDSGIKHTFYITPSFGHTDSVSDCNRLVDTWMGRLRKVQSEHRSLLCK
jgi:hypothetical protein